jgi:hypothetical protein
MTEQLRNITYKGQKIDDFESFDRIPDYLKDFLSRQNGLIALDGGFHIRGCVLTPKWHSLGYAWFGELKLSNLFDNLTPNDIPIAQDCFGYQYLIRDNQIIRLLTETGDLEFLETDFYRFIELVKADPIGILNVENIDRFDLKPGQLLSVIPPFCIKSDSDRLIKPIDSEERIRFLSSLSRQISNLPDGTNIEIETK